MRRARYFLLAREWVPSIILLTSFGLTPASTSSPTKREGLAPVGSDEFHIPGIGGEAVEDMFRDLLRERYLEGLVELHDAQGGGEGFRHDVRGVLRRVLPMHGGR